MKAEFILLTSLARHICKTYLSTLSYLYDHIRNSITTQQISIKQYVKELLRSNVLLCYRGNEINKPLHSYGHVLIVAHVGGSHKTL
jgi:hypothetical protein